MGTGAYKYDQWGHPIQGGTELKTQAFNLTNSTWTAVQLSAGEYCKQFAVKTRSGSNFKSSSNFNGHNYITVTGSISVEMLGHGVLLYAQSVDATDTLELLYTD